MIRVGMMIGDRYEILERIGTGGMSDVYKAKDHKLNRHVAVKVLKQEFSENTNFVSKFRVEAQAAASLMHPNIVNVYDVGEDNGVYYIVMELVEGITLKKYIEKKARLSVREAVSIAIQACMGIEAAHNNHIIHRDIKPQNIIISKDGKVKVTDFGIAKAATSNTITSNVMGSVHYTSPEQARGGYSDEKSDIYSMGITLFEMLTGRVPFNGETTVAIAIKHIQEPMPSPREFVPEIPVSVEQIVLKCTQKSPDRRYHTMAALIEDLKRALMSPDEDFVRIENPDESMATRAVSDRERGEIKKQSKKKESSGEEIRLKKNTPPKKKKTVVYEEDDEEEEYEDEDSRMERITTVLAVIGAVLIGCAVIFLVGRAVGIFDFGQESEQVTMIAVENMTEEEAVKALTELGLKPEVTYAVSDSVEVGKVISADVKEGAIVSGGSRVVLTVSGREETAEDGIPVPDVEGFLEAEATATLTNNGFTAEKSEGYSDTVEKGRVISQTPAGGSSAAPGTAVSIVISQGPDLNSKVVMPDIIGMDPDLAISTLVENGLMVGEQRDMSDDDPAMTGKVCYASYTAGALVEPGTTIDIGISTGPASTTYMYQDAIQSPAVAEPGCGYQEGSECQITITGQSGAEYLNTTVRTFPYTSVNIHGIPSEDPAGLITYTFEVEEAPRTEVGENGETVTVPGGKSQKVVQVTVFFTPEG
ncbi:MAG TPA: Stk1 family PASTA domain-containing Ser/Thr kinase [Candidatus Eisenbergiella merdigallinarum]|uniref:non-specific serine/threonine protein kinase n=1 Tax=Candidatus Eisenbergiella merdigallinarum TaxID=2838552 RepID=A0A9D2SDG8_9FIRM|nr:Stk1 family PASTA domain-containing Ser/Thr kinase [Candidatus Eisenbergiella merdigallinarum]